MFSCGIKYLMYEPHVIHKLHWLLCWNCCLLMFWQSQIALCWSDCERCPPGEESGLGSVCWRCGWWWARPVTDCSSGFTGQVFQPSELQSVALNCQKWNPENSIACCISLESGTGELCTTVSLLPGGNELVRNTSSFTSLGPVHLFDLPFLKKEMQKYLLFLCTVVCFCGSWFAFQLGTLTACWCSPCASSGPGWAAWTTFSSVLAVDLI